MEHISLQSQHVFDIGPFVISNSMIASWLTIIILTIMALFIYGRIKLIPGGFQNFMELIVESLLNLVDNVTQDRRKTEKFLPWILTFFLFILASNWMELIPGYSAIGLKSLEEGKSVFVPFFRSANTDLNTTLALALISVTLTQFFGIAAIGFFKYAKKFINFSSFTGFFVGLLELVSETAKIISFAFRLFGNIFAGEVLLAIIVFLVPVFASMPFLGLEIFVGLIQALVFAMLTLVFITVATAGHEAH